MQKTKIKVPRSVTIRRRVRATAVFLNSNKVQQDILTTNQNLNAINSSLFVAKKHGIKHWESVSQNSRNNTEIIRELYANQLEVKF